MTSIWLIVKFGFWHKTICKYVKMKYKEKWDQPYYYRNHNVLSELADTV